MRLGTWDVRGLYRSGSLGSEVRELARYTFDLGGVQGVWWDKGRTVRAVDFIFFLWKKKQK